MYGSDDRKIWNYVAYNLKKSYERQNSTKQHFLAYKVPDLWKLGETRSRKCKHSVL